RVVMIDTQELRPRAEQAALARPGYEPFPCSAQCLVLVGADVAEESDSHRRQGCKADIHRGTSSLNRVKVFQPPFGEVMHSGGGGRAQAVALPLAVTGR